MKPELYRFCCVLYNFCKIRKVSHNFYVFIRPYFLLFTEMFSLVWLMYRTSLMRNKTEIIIALFVVVFQLRRKISLKIRVFLVTKQNMSILFCFFKWLKPYNLISTKINYAPTHGKVMEFFYINCINCILVSNIRNFFDFVQWSHKFALKC